MIPAQESLGILGKPLFVTTTTTTTLFTYFIYPIDPCGVLDPLGMQAYFWASDVGVRGVQPGCRGHGVKAYLMRPVASISLGVKCKVTARLRHQRHRSYVQDYGRPGRGWF